MRMTRSFHLITGLLLLGVLAGLSGCGTNTSSSTPPQPQGSKPDRVQIEVQSPLFGPTGRTPGPPLLTLKDNSLVRQLYTTIYSLPLMPEQRACTAELGPHYLLTFYQGQKKLVSAQANNDGCRQVTLSGEQHDRTAMDHRELWGQIDSAIYAATPPARVDWLSLLTTPANGKFPQVARITSISSAQAFYDAILALKPIVKNNAYLDTNPDYQLNFHTANQELAVAIDLKNQQVALFGMLRTRGGVYHIDEQFKQLLSKTVAGVTFAPAKPTELTVRLDTAKINEKLTNVTDMQLLQKLYARIFTFPTTQPPPDSCLGNDKLAGKSKWYTLTFSQWKLNVLSITAYEGSCRFITRNSYSGNGQYLQADKTFWNLLHQAAGA